MFATLIRSHPTPPENPHTYLFALGLFKRNEGTRPSTRVLTGPGQSAHSSSMSLTHFELLAGLFVPEVRENGHYACVCLSVRHESLMSLCSSPSFGENLVSFSLMHMPCLCLLLFEKDRRSSGHIIEDYINPRVGEFVLFVSVGESACFQRG